jgi:hypothetical protein
MLLPRRSIPHWISMGEVRFGGGLGSV